MTELVPNLGWINTREPLALNGFLRGQIVILLFWDSGRVACQDALAEAKSVAARFRDEPVVLVGVHDTRFRGLAGLQAVERSLVRLGVSFPVVVDDRYGIWRRYTVRSSPTTIIVDPGGHPALRVTGEGNQELLERTIDRLLDEHRRADTLATGRVRLERNTPARSVSRLFGPAKVVAQTPSVGRPGYLFIADTGNHRIVVADWPDSGGSAQIKAVFGTGDPGCVDGSAQQAQFSQPRGMAFDPEKSLLYVADTGNHAVRLIDLKQESVRTIIGRPRRGHDIGGGGSGTNQALNMPWDIAIDTRASRLFIAMPGVHQIWSAELDTMVTRSIVGSGREDVKDGSGSESAFAQPCALSLAADRKTLYCIDSQGSALRAIDLASRTVRTIAGGLHEGGVSPLDSFGFRDGEAPLFAQPQGITIEHGQGEDNLFVADSANGKVRVVSARTGVAATLATDEPMPGVGDVSFAHALASKTQEPRLFLADTLHDRILRREPDGKLTEIGLAGLASIDAKGVGVQSAAFNVPMHEPMTMTVPGVSGLGPGQCACFRIGSWLNDREDRVIAQRTRFGSRAGQDQDFQVGADCVDQDRTLLVEVSSESGMSWRWRVRFGTDGGEPRLRAP